MITLDNVGKSWDGGATFTVRGVSVTVPQGKVLALLGGSGCGKSTTVKMINRLIEPTEGRIEIDGDDAMQLDPVQLRRRIGYVFQGIGLFPHMTVADNVAIVPRLLGWSRERYQPRVEQLLDLVHLPPAEFADRLPAQLSGGQRQRVGFARALAVEPKVMLLDEPFGALDPVTRDSLQTEFKGIQQELELTVIMVTHDMAEAMLLADRIAVMNEGEILREGTAAELLRDPGHEYVASLLATPRRHGELVRQIENGMHGNPGQGGEQPDDKDAHVQ